MEENNVLFLTQYFHQMEKDLLMRLSREIRQGFTDMACDYGESNHTISTTIEQLEIDTKDNRDFINSMDRIIDGLTRVIKQLKTDMTSLRREIANLRSEVTVLKCDVKFGR